MPESAREGPGLWAGRGRIEKRYVWLLAGVALMGATLACRQPDAGSRDQADAGADAAAVSAEPVPAAPSWPSFVSWSLELEPLDMVALGRLHADLLARLRGIEGVSELETCAPRQRLLIEVDAARASGYGVDPVSMQVSLRERLSTMQTLDIEALRTTVVAGKDTALVTLADLAAIRYGFAEPTCVAAGAHALAASATLGVADAGARERADQVLTEFAEALPPGARLHRFGPTDSFVAFDIDPSLAREQVAESIAGGFAREREAWLLEVGVDACTSTSTRARLSLRGRDRVDPGSIDSFRTIPGVTGIELVDATALAQPRPACPTNTDDVLGTLLDAGVPIAVSLRFVPASE